MGLIPAFIFSVRSSSGWLLDCLGLLFVFKFMTLTSSLELG